MERICRVVGLWLVVMVGICSAQYSPSTYQSLFVNADITTVANYVNVQMVGQTNHLLYYIASNKGTNTCDPTVDAAAVSVIYEVSFDGTTWIPNGRAVDVTTLAYHRMQIQGSFPYVRVGIYGTSGSNTNCVMTVKYTGSNSSSVDDSAQSMNTRTCSVGVSCPIADAFNGALVYGYNILNANTTTVGVVGISCAGWAVANVRVPANQSVSLMSIKPLIQCNGPTITVSGGTGTPGDVLVQLYLRML